MSFDQATIARMIQELHDLSADRHRLWRDLDAAKQRIEELDRLRIEQDRWYREHCEDQAKLEQRVDVVEAAIILFNNTYRDPRVKAGQ